MNLPFFEPEATSPWGCKSITIHLEISKKYFPLSLYRICPTVDGCITGDPSPRAGIEFGTPSYPNWFTSTPEDADFTNSEEILSRYKCKTCGIPPLSGIHNFLANPRWRLLRCGVGVIWHDPWTRWTESGKTYSKYVLYFQIYLCTFFICKDKFCSVTKTKLISNVQ